MSNTINDKSRLLFLDDERIPIDCANYMGQRNVNTSIYHLELSIVRSYTQFIKWINENGLPDLISFDHDLADVPELRAKLDIEEWFNLESNKEYTGMDCARWLTNYCLDNNSKLPLYVVHSANSSGAKNIESILESFIKNFN